MFSALHMQRKVRAGHFTAHRQEENSVWNEDKKDGTARMNRAYAGCFIAVLGHCSNLPKK